MATRVRDLGLIEDPIARAAAADEAIAAGQELMNQARAIRAKALREAIDTGLVTQAELARRRGVKPQSLIRMMWEAR